MTLRSLHDRKGQELIDGVPENVDRLKPSHLPIGGGDPLVRCRELELLTPLLLDRGIHVQVVANAFRPLAPSWATQAHINVVVSIDGLQPEHDVRRAPATSEFSLVRWAGAIFVCPPCAGRRDETKGGGMRSAPKVLAVLAVTSSWSGIASALRARSESDLVSRGLKAVMRDRTGKGITNEGTGLHGGSDRTRTRSLLSERAGNSAFILVTR
jgi:hypothetical protein